MASKRNKNNFKPVEVETEVEAKLQEEETPELEEKETEEVEAEDVEETAETKEPETTEAPVVEEPKAQVKEEPIPMHEGLVVNCMKLNIRKGPGKEYTVHETIPVGKKVIVRDCENPEWFKIPGKGYVMKKFIKIK